MDELVEGVDVIVNAAAESHVEKSITDGASEFVTTNVEGAQILLDAIRHRPIERFILISSSEVYGTAEAAPMDEQHALNPRSPYAATKAGADRLAYSYWTTYDLPIAIIRSFNNYGPRQIRRRSCRAHHAGALDEPDDPRRRPCVARLVLRDRRCRGVGSAIDAPLRDRRRGVNVAGSTSPWGARALGGRQGAGAAALRRGAARAGRSPRRLHRQGGAAASLARPHVVRRGPGAHRRVVSRQ